MPPIKTPQYISDFFYLHIFLTFCTPFSHRGLEKILTMLRATISHRWRVNLISQSLRCHCSFCSASMPPKLPANETQGGATCSRNSAVLHNRESYASLGNLAQNGRRRAALCGSGATPTASGPLHVPKAHREINALFTVFTVRPGIRKNQAGAVFFPPRTSWSSINEMKR